MNKLSTVVTNILVRDSAPRSSKVSPPINRINDPTPHMVDTRQTYGVHPTLTQSRFRRGDWVIDAVAALETTGLSEERLARQVVDLDRHETGWLVGVERCEGRFEHESQYILLEDVDSWTPHCNQGTFFWKKTLPTY